jgi:hypothetical protein
MMDEKRVSLKKHVSIEIKDAVRFPNKNLLENGFPNLNAWGEPESNQTRITTLAML